TIAADLADRGSRLTRTDLVEYEAIVREPITTNVGNWTVATTPPPAVGGVTLSAILRLVAASDAPTDPTEWAENTRDRPRRSPTCFGVSPRPRSCGMGAPGQPADKPLWLHRVYLCGGG